MVDDCFAPVYTVMYLLIGTLAYCTQIRGTVRPYLALSSAWQCSVSEVWPRFDPVVLPVCWFTDGLPSSSNIEGISIHKQAEKTYLQTAALHLTQDTWRRYTV